MNINKKILSLILFMLVLSVSSCDEDEFLQEEPLDFFSPENSFVTFGDFDRAVVDLYARYRDYRYGVNSPSGNNTNSFSTFCGTDLWFDARLSTNTIRIGDYNVSLDPTSVIVEWHWDRMYKIVANSNTIIDRVAESDLSEDEKTQIEAEAKLFRALAYRSLVYLYGGVPLTTSEVRSAEAKFTRATPNEILSQIVDDASFAASNLLGIDEVSDGRLSNLVANHLLAETYISLEQWDNAIAAASAVIDNGVTALMMSRFGTRSGEPGDVYWDLFRRGNQNRSSGNTEAIWVAQIEIDVPGGMLASSNRSGNPLERFHVPVPRSIRASDGERLVEGYPVSDTNQGGRGVSFMQPTSFFENQLWTGTDFDNDIRNSEFNYVRVLEYTNPDSEFFGSNSNEQPLSTLGGNNNVWRWYPWLTKATTAGNHPEELYDDSRPNPNALTNGAGSTYRDMYFIRLAETYLLRAEAHLGRGDGASAAADINAVRERSNASPVTAGEVTLDYILDERARELSLEEERAVTLRRVGKLVERTRLYNPHNADDIQDKHALFPIPFAEIEANINAVLEQNPGY